MSKEAMNLALEALKVSVPVILGNFSRHSKAIAALEALAEQPAQQEPVGTYQEIMRTMIALRTGTVVQQQAYELMKDKQLYTSPPAQRTWVSLTDEEIRILANSLGFGPYVREVVRAAEAKLKEKNQ